MKANHLASALIVLLLAAGCADYDRGGKQTIGGLSGAALGGLFGSTIGSGKGKLIATASGVFIGALIGSEIGRSMDKVDRMKANEAITQAHAAPLGETITWNNPRNQNYGTVTAVRDGTSSSGSYCREFQQSITVGGKTEEGYGVACRQPDGAWRIVQS